MFLLDDDKHFGEEWIKIRRVFRENVIAFHNFFRIYKVLNMIMFCHLQTDCIQASIITPFLRWGRSTHFFTCYDIFRYFIIPYKYVNREIGFLDS